MAVRILIVEDHVLFAEAIRFALEGSDMVVVGTAATGEEALAAARASCPDLVLLDIGLPDRNGLGVGREILQVCPDTKVLALTVVDDPRIVREALRSGFHGYVLKDMPVARFVQAVEAVIGGQVVTPGRVVPKTTGSPAWDDGSVALLVSQLTHRELEVLDLLVAGAEGETIARRLGISPNTVRTHVQSILVKLQVHSRLEAVAFAVRHDVTSAWHRSDRGTAWS